MAVVVAVTANDDEDNITRDNDGGDGARTRTNRPGDYDVVLGGGNSLSGLMPWRYSAP